MPVPAAGKKPWKTPSALQSRDGGQQTRHDAGSVSAFETEKWWE